jgi:beta-lactamase superfamily II metal-dependent hydrolase
MAGKLKAPKNGITIRMYRIGHGDCFLLALPREQGDDPFYILIDCGRKGGSQNYIHKKPMGDIVEHIGEATGHHLDLVIITHEHQDHVNGFWKKHDPYFGDIHIERAWLAWTEDPNDELANELRAKHGDQLLNLVEARSSLALAVGENDAAVSRLDSFLSLEFGGEDDQFDLEAMRAAATDPSKSTNKQAMKFVKDKASENQGVRYLSPGGVPLEVEGTAGVRTFVLAPPRDEDLLEKEDPVGSEKFLGRGSGPHGLSFAAALGPNLEGRATPFSERYRVPTNRALRRNFFKAHYGREGTGERDYGGVEVATNAPWRRIDSEWLFTAESLALKLNRGINNTSLVLAFELPKSKKVLLFTGDAQRGNWISWDDDDNTWDDNGQEITARDLLGRTVLYKVGHHGSHNATLDGQLDDDYPNLSWMGINESKGEFTAMITAVNEWAMEKNNPPWQHPLPSIKEALERKAQGRVFQTDVNKPKEPENVSDADWQAFLERSSFEELYFDYTILDE